MRFALAISLLLASVAHADDAGKPWTEGVPDDRQRLARELFEQGNALVRDGLYAQALDKLREALAHWDHPQIHYNAAIALINLERPLEALEELDAALRWDGQGIDPDLLEQAHAYRRLLEGQTALVTVQCLDEGTAVELDGAPFLDCPGHRTTRMLAGAHRLDAEGDGYLARAVPLALAGGDDHFERIDLWSDAEATVTRRRWAWWKPWVVVGAGAGVGVVGLALQLDARAAIQGYDNAVTVLCPEGDMPCDDLPDSVTDALARGRLESKIAVGVMVAAGATVAAGLVGAYLNREVHERIGYEVQAAPGELGVAVRGRW